MAAVSHGFAKHRAESHRGGAQLGEYRRKRDPGRRPSRSAAVRRGREPIFVVQRHDARRLHYDFRLERDGALASWAVPNGVPLEPGQRHLAVHVEDHPLDYAAFEGEIPKGNYGAGSVEIWDRGTYELVEEKHDGGLTVRLHGERLQGTWTLVPRASRGEEKNWLLIRKRDETPPAPEPRRRAATRRCSRRSRKWLPQGEDWLFEVKWDGYRALAYLDGGVVALRSRKDNDLTARFPTVGAPSARRCGRRAACSTGRSARSTRTAARRSRRCSRARRGRRTSTSPSTCSRPTASRWSACR